MPIIDDDWKINGSTGEIRYIGDDHHEKCPSYATVRELHSWLRYVEAEGDSTHKNHLINSVNKTTHNWYPSYTIKLINGYNINDMAAQHLYNGSIIQKDDEEIYDSIVNAGNVKKIEIEQNGVPIANDFWNRGKGGVFNSSGPFSHNFMIKVRSDGIDIDNRKIVAKRKGFPFFKSQKTILATERGKNFISLSMFNWDALWCVIITNAITFLFTYLQT